MRRAAFLLFGHMRSYERTYPSYQKMMNFLSSNYECDVYIHTWDRVEPQTKTWHNDSLKTDDLISENKITKMYQPKRLLIETQYIKDPNRLIFGQSYEGIRYSHYSRFKVNQLKEETGIGYDLVLTSRPDVWYYSNFFEDELDDVDRIWICRVFAKNSATDIVSFSSNDNMNLLCDYYHHFDQVLGSGFSKNEHAFEHYLSTLDVPYTYSTYTMPRDWRIFRSSWDDINHHVGDKKWDRDLAIYEIDNNDEYSYFKR